MSHCCCMESINFNPRSREGSDSCLRRSGSFPSNFNPRSREGSDSATLVINNDMPHFNTKAVKALTEYLNSKYEGVTFHGINDTDEEPADDVERF